MDYKEKYNKLLDAVKELQEANPSDEGIQNWINDNVPELAESEDERIREALIRFHKSTIDIDGIKGADIVAWIEKQGKPIDEEKVLIGARKYIALSIINYLDNNSIGMCLSNMECEDIEDACVNSKWTKLYNYMKKKLEKQGEQKSCWKPTKEQFEALNYAYNSCSGTEIGNYYEGVLETLIDDLYSLEKQGSPVLSNSSNVGKNEKCSADRIVPKFKAGDWIVFANGNVERITNVGTHGYIFDDGDYLLHENCDKQAHLWSIADAKDGDVLACESGWTCIFKTLVNDETFSSYCFMDKTKWFCETESECHTLNKEFTKAYSGEIKPATKERRDLLFSKMKEAGYVWDSNKKELKKIKQNIGWSEEDEERIKNIFSVLDVQVCWDGATGEKKNPYQKEIEWLKPLKDRVQPKQEWCKEDEQIILSIEQVMNCASLLNIVPEKIDKIKSWLKSLKQKLGGEK